MKFPNLDRLNKKRFFLFFLEKSTSCKFDGKHPKFELKTKFEQNYLTGRIKKQLVDLLDIASSSGVGAVK